MSKRIFGTIVLFMIVCLGLFFGPNLSPHETNVNHYNPDKQALLQVDIPKHGRVLKVGQSIVATIAPVSRPGLFSDSIQLQGRIEFLDEVDTAKIYWELPQGTAVLSGSTEINLSNPDRIVEIPIEVGYDNTTNLQLHLKVDAVKNNMPMGAVTQFDTFIDLEKFDSSGERLPAAAAASDAADGEVHGNGEGDKHHSHNHPKIVY